MRKTVLAFLFLGIAAIAFRAGRGFDGGPRHGGPTLDGRRVLYYVDPMNPRYRADEPGIAPCGMPLEPIYEEGGEMQWGSAATLPPGTVRITPARQQLIGVRVAPVKVEPMTFTLRLYGKVVPDETLIHRLNASTDSWIRSLSPVTTGSIVKKGQILAEALAPSYYNAQVTYLIALDNLDRIRRQLGGELRHQQGDLADNQIRVAVQALQNLGISDAQIEELANTRRAQPYLQVRSPARGVVLARNVTLNQWFKAADEFFTIADIGRVWVYADVYEDEARHIRPGMAVTVAHAQMGRTFDAKVSQVLPLFDRFSKTLKVRLDVVNPAYELRPDMFVEVQIPIVMAPSLHVPADAVIDSGAKTIVYVDLGKGAFEPRRVQTGWRLGRRIEITAGLSPGEMVVVAGNFLIDSESRMRTLAPVAEDGMGPERNGPEVPRDGGGGNAGAAATQGGWLADLERGRAGRGSGRGADGRGEERAQDVFGTSTGSEGVVDWDGPDADGGAAGRDWRGWGKFPGARYLGVPDKAAAMSSSVEVTPPHGEAAQSGVEPNASPPAPSAQTRSLSKDQGQEVGTDSDQASAPAQS